MKMEKQEHLKWKNDDSYSFPPHVGLPLLMLKALLDVI
jgi:hypothetical protein